MKAFLLILVLTVFASTFVWSSDPTRYEKVGCFRDSGNTPRPLPTMLADLRPKIDWYNMNKTVDQCSALVQAKGFEYFGIQFYGECYSGANAAITYARDGRSGKCWSGVGMAGAYFVYRFVKSATWVKVPYKFIEGHVMSEKPYQSADHVPDTCKSQCVKHAGCKAIRLYEIVGTTYCTLFSTVTGYKCPSDSFDLECIIADGESWKLL